MILNSYASESTGNRRKFPAGYKLAQGRHGQKRKGTYGCDAARKKLGEEAAVQGAGRGSGEFSPALSASPARQYCKGKVAAAAMAQMEVLEWRLWGRRRETLRTPIYSRSQITGALPRGFRGVAGSSVALNSVVAIVVVHLSTWWVTELEAVAPDRVRRSTKKPRRRGHLVKCTQVPDGSG